MNKKGFAIMPRELIFVGIGLLFGLGSWFIFSSFKDFIIEKFGTSPVTNIIIGAVILLFVLFIVKYKPYKYVIG